MILTSFFRKSAGLTFIPGNLNLLAFAQGLLLMRAGYNLTKDNTPISFSGISSKIFSKIDKYALASAGAIELPGTLLATGAAILSGNLPLIISAGLWSVANGFLIASDPALRKSTEIKPK